MKKAKAHEKKLIFAAKHHLTNTDEPNGIQLGKEKMKKFAFLIAAMLFISGTFYAQTLVTYEGLKLSEFENQQSLQMSGSSFTRGHGFVIRPEFYRGIYASFGYQFNPFIQSYFSIGYGDAMTLYVGLRCYTNDSNWAGMFDTRFGFNGYGFNQSLIGGASYKDLDFGLGWLFYYPGDIDFTILPAISIGWNIRCYPHK